MQVVLNDDIAECEYKRRVRTRTNLKPYISLTSQPGKFRVDDNKLAPALHAFNYPMAKRSVRVSDDGVVAPHEDASRRFPSRIIITISEELGVIADKQTARFKRGREHARRITSLPRKKTRTIIRSPQAQRHKLSIAVDVTTRTLRHPNRFGTVLFDDGLHFALDDVIRLIPGDALESVLSPVFLSSLHRVSQAVFVIQHLLERQTTRAKTTLVVRVFRIALDFFEYTILHVHKNAAVVVAAWA